jgi:hypothetical protein
MTDNRKARTCECCERKCLDVTWRCPYADGLAAMLCSTCAMQIAEARLEVAS